MEGEKDELMAAAAVAAMVVVNVNVNVNVSEVDKATSGGFSTVVIDQVLDVRKREGRYGCVGWCKLSKLMWPDYGQ